MFKIKRAYEPATRDDGFRVLVERLWPRGVTREALALDLWLKDVAPSAELRKWFGHDPQKWGEFRKRYRAELGHNREAIDLLLVKEHEERVVTLVYAARDEEHNSARLLQEYLQAHHAGKALKELTPGRGDAETRRKIPVTHGR